MVWQKKSASRAVNLARELNKARHKLLRQLELLCSNLVSANRVLAERINELTFAVQFYERIFSSRSTEEIFPAAAEMIYEHTKGGQCAFFMLTDESFEVHLHQQSRDSDGKIKAVIEGFKYSLVNEISRSRRVYQLDDMAELGLSGKLGVLKEISFAAIPLNRLGRPAGFVLLYKNADTPVSREDIDSVRSVSWVLTKAFDKQTAAFC